MFHYEDQQPLLEGDASSKPSKRSFSRKFSSCINYSKQKIMLLSVCVLMMFYSGQMVIVLVAEPKGVSVDILWTWTCVNNTCERHHTSEGNVIQSLPTCRMFCGPPQLWPLPTAHYSISKNIVPVDADLFSLVIDQSSSKKVSQYITNAFYLFRRDLRNTAASGKIVKYKRSVPTFRVSVQATVLNDPDPKLRLDTDESYELALHPRHDKHLLVARISAASFCGFRNGLETLSQLIWVDPYLRTLVSFERAQVEDAPKFRYRGLMLDTARNFFPVEDIKRTLDAMAANKLNTFHWHATDSQSFPLALEAAPELAKFGAYRPDAVYTRKDIKAIVRHARLRGIRVVIEIDAPSHTGDAFSWGPSAGMDHLVTCVNAEPWSSFCGEPPCGQLNPKNPHVYTLLEELFAETIELTGVTDVFHLGGDEVNENCWRQEFPGMSPEKLGLEFMRNVSRALKRANKGRLPELTIIWSSSLTQPPELHYLDRKKVAIQLWGSSSAPDQRIVLQLGYRSIISHVNPWYLDCGLGSWQDDSDGHCSPYSQWREVYNHRPWGQEKWRLEGGEACQWSEQLGPEGLDTRLWPRAAALAERLWTDPHHTVNPDVLLRLETHRSRLMARGIKVEPLWNRWCTQNPNECL